MDSKPVSFSRCRVLLVYPQFIAPSFWNFKTMCELAGASYPMAPLGLITVAAMLPASWELRLIDRNVTRLTASDIDWADLIMTTGMLPQQLDTLEVIRLCQERGKPVAVGGPDVTSSPEVYKQADIRVLGEAELVIDHFIDAWDSGERRGVFEAEKFKADVTRTPIPRSSILARLPIHMRVLRHYRALWTSASYENQPTNAGGDRNNLQSRIPRPPRFCR
jgi:radical SAM superfamily enzyme YgiQ (UPF0313 family)